MSTRALIIVKDDFEEYGIYRHSDGYPYSKHGVIYSLQEAFVYAWPLPRFEAADFAAAIIAGWKDEGGGGVYLSETDTVDVDVDYIYTINEVDGDIWIEINDGREDEVFSGFYTEAVKLFSRGK